VVSVEKLQEGRHYPLDLADLVVIESGSSERQGARAADPTFDP